MPFLQEHIGYYFIDLIKYDQSMGFVLSTFDICAWIYYKFKLTNMKGDLTKNKSIISKNYLKLVMSTLLLNIQNIIKHSDL